MRFLPGRIDLSITFHACPGKFSERRAFDVSRHRNLVKRFGLMGSKPNWAQMPTRGKKDMASSSFEERSDGRELVGSPVIKKCHLDQPLDTEMERLLIRAAVMVGYQVFVTEVSDGPLSIETADPADVGLPEPTRVDNDIRRLFIDGREITFVLAPETWSQTPRREDWIYEDIQSTLSVDKPGAGKVQSSKLMEYRVQYGAQVERQAREEDQTRTADTACLPVEPTNQTAPSPLDRVPAPSERATQEGRDQGHGAPPMTDEGTTVRSQAMLPPETRQRAITEVGRMETVDEFKSLPPVLLRELGLEILMERAREFDPGDTPDAPPVKSGDGAHADGVGQPASEKEISADRNQGTGDETDTEKGNKRKVLLLKMPASLPLDKPPTGIFATGPSIEKMVAEHPELLPTVSLVARLEMAQAEAEVAFRRCEATEDWGSWSGVHPWDDKPELETTDCPWWVAGAEYEFRMAAEWRQYFPAKPERTRALLPAQLRSLAKDVYQNKVFYYDLIYSKHPKGKDLSPQTHVERFSNFAFLFAKSKFEEKDLSEWEQRAALAAEAIVPVVNIAPPREATLVEPANRGGRPLKAQTRDIHAEWARLGKPRKTAAVCDRIAEVFFPAELKGVRRGSQPHRKVRERVRQAIQRFERRSAT
jgi:hypothetical protein